MDCHDEDHSRLKLLAYTECVLFTYIVMTRITPTLSCLPIQNVFSLDMDCHDEDHSRLKLLAYTECVLFRYGLS